MHLLRYVSFAALAALVLAAPAAAQSPEEREALGLPDGAPSIRPAGTDAWDGTNDVLAVVDSENDQVILLDPNTGNLIDPAFLNTAPGALGTPKHAIANFTATGLFISDQIDDVVYEYDSNGDSVRVFAPAGGPNPAILDNIIGLRISPSGTELWVTVTGGTNQDAVARFDQSGNYLGNLIANGAGGLDGPFDVDVYQNTLLVTAIGTDDILRYSLAGAFLGVFHASDGAAGIDFPQQLDVTTTSGNVLAAGFSAPSGVFEYNSTGAEVGRYTPVTGVRGVYELPTGNILTTSGTGVHEITRAGALVRTIVPGVSAQYIELIPGSAVPVEMLYFEGAASGRDALLSWGTASETNNAGFEVLTRRDGAWAALGFVEGHGTTTEAQAYTFRAVDLDPGTHAFRLRQVDYDGASEFSDAVEVTIGVPGSHLLTQAYPNPFNPSASFTLAVAQTQAVTVALYDALGRRVATLFEGTLEGGAAQRLTIDGRGLPSGVYHYRAAGETFVESRSVVLMK
ncbi:MAG TPA: T9SS type A sorting domain-containing protein [Rubricoccaceae bacterium]|nr:T9SS type A sorting domain-containing protein [Rubricoccaceae bacterium]